MKPSKWYVYSPDDEPDSQQHDGKVYHLPANGTAEFASKATALFVASKLEPWGACLVSGPVVDGVPTNPEDQKLVDAAEQQYLRGTLRWAEDVLREDLARLKKLEGIDTHAPLPSADAKRARGWIEKYHPRLRREGLIG